ncbi:MAG: DEAD/DEAH box helicase, partial [Tissierellia bacterium]|nr:DEAD/DEAH box helicase [Tissierellia bacterium]
MINEDIQYLKGVGPIRALKLQKLDIFTVGDLLNYFPVKYEDRRVVKNINEIFEQGKYLLKLSIFEKPKHSRIKKNMTIIKAICKDDTGFITLTFFNQDFLMDKLIAGEYYYVFGNVKISFGKLEITNPEIELMDKDWKAGNIMPVYALTYGLSNNEITKLVKTALETYYDQIQDVLPKEIIKKYDLTSKKIAIKNLHFPSDSKKYSLSKRTIAFEKLLIMQLGLFNIKNNLSNELSDIALRNTMLSEKLLSSIPYKLTKAQLKVISEIKEDLKSKKTMNRLIQGDVGSGKTVVAVYSLLMAVGSGYQSSMMAPTEILALQHYETIKEYIETADLNV